MGARGLAAGACVWLLLVAAPALAFWTAGNAGGSATATAGTMPAGAQPSASANGSTVTVTWSQASLPGLGSLSGAGGGYVVTRYAAGSSVPVTPGGGCAGLVAAAGAVTSCGESAVPDGPWRYTVTPKLNAWSGAESPASATVLVDTVAPTTTASVSPAANGAGWTSSSVTVTLTATDDPGGSGVSSVSYALVGAQAGGSTTYATPFTVSAQGTTTISFGATDYAGNTETTQTRQVRIDTTAPTGSITSPGAGAVVGGTTTVAASSADGLSGVASVAFERAPAGSSAWTRYATDVAAPYQASLDTTALADGSWQLRVVTTDNAGNVFTSPTRSVVVDNRLPFGVDVQAQNGGTLGTIDAGDTVTLTFSEPMLPASMLAGWTGAAQQVAVRVQNGGNTGDRLTVVNGNLGVVRLGLRTWVRSGTTSLDATMTLTGGTTLLLTITGCSSGCGNLVTNVGATTFTWSPSSGATDLAGNAMDTGSVAQSNGPQHDL